MTTPTPVPRGSIEQRLSDALEARASQVRAEDLAPAAPPSPDPRRRWRGYAVGAVAASVVLVVGAAVVGLGGSDDRSDGPTDVPTATDGAGRLPQLWPVDDLGMVVDGQITRFDHLFRLVAGDGSGPRIEVGLATEAANPVWAGTEIDVPPGAVPSFVGTLAADEPVVVVSVSAAAYSATDGASETTAVFAATSDAAGLVELEQPAAAGGAGPTLDDATVWIVDGRLFSTTTATLPADGAAPEPGVVWEWEVRDGRLAPVDLGEVCVGLPATRPDGGGC